MKKNLEKRINNMSETEARNLVANLQINAVPPYRLHTHPMEFTIHTFGVDCTGRVNTETRDAARAFHDLGMDRIREIAGTVLKHPTLGAECLEAMMSGRKVVINVERHVAAPQSKRIRPSSQMVERIEQHLLN